MYIYALLNYVYIILNGLHSLHQLHPDNAPHVSVVISPLRSLMRDQVDKCRSMGIKSCMITKLSDMTPEDIECES